MIKNKRKLFMLLIAMIKVLIISSCNIFDFNNGALQETNFLGKNNSKEFLAEYPLGDMLVENYEISKKVPIVIGENSSEFLLCSMANITDKTIGGVVYTYITIPVKNITTSYSLPFIKANNIIYSTNNGKVKAKNTFTFCYGSIGRMVSNCSNTCLAPGEEGYFILIDNVYWNKINSIGFDIEFSDFYIEEPFSKIMPTDGYIKEGTYNHDKLVFEYKNYGEEKAEIEWLGNIVFFFENYDSEIPIYFTYIDHDSFLDTVYPLGTGTFESGNIYFEGYYKKVRVQLNYCDYDLSRNINFENRNDQMLEEQLLNYRNEEIMKKIDMIEMK